MTEELAKLLLKVKAVSLDARKGFTYASGRKGPIYCDNRIILSFPKERDIVVNSFVQLIKEKCPAFDIVAGVATGAIAWGALVADRFKKPMIYIRSAAKDHGKENLIEGRLEKGQKVIVIEDLINTGGSSVDACKAVIDQGGAVVACVALFSYGFSDAQKKFSDVHIPLSSLTDFDALVNVAIATNYLDAAYNESLASWHSNPKEWQPKN